MTWRPSIAQLCTIAEMHHARAPLERIAESVGVSVDDFKAWRQRCMNVVVAEYASPMQAPPPKPGVFKS
jgi:hypothetical protein